MNNACVFILIHTQISDLSLSESSVSLSVREHVGGLTFTETLNVFKHCVQDDEDVLLLCLLVRKSPKGPPCLCVWGGVQWVHH